MFSTILPTHCPKEEGTAMLFPSEDGCRPIGYDLRQLLVHSMIRKLSIFRLDLTSELVLPKMASPSAITKTHVCVAVGVVVRRSHVPSASFVSSHARVASFPLQSMPSIDPFVSFGSSHHVPLPWPSPTRATTRQDVRRSWYVHAWIDCAARFVPEQDGVDFHVC